MKLYDKVRTIRKNTHGFTLIELLVVIAIIGILSAVVLVSLGSARSRGRDSRRQTDLAELQSALALYSENNSGAYPVNTGTEGCADFRGMANALGSPPAGQNPYVTRVVRDLRDNATPPTNTWANNNAPTSTQFCYSYLTSTFSTVALGSQAGAGAVCPFTTSNTGFVLAFHYENTPAAQADPPCSFTVTGITPIDCSYSNIHCIVEGL